MMLVNHHQSVSKRSKVLDKASSAKSQSAPIITTDTLRSHKSLLIDKKAQEIFLRKNFFLNRGLNLENLPTKDLYTCKVR
jgi:hypothetical protein